MKLLINFLVFSMLTLFGSFMTAEQKEKVILVIDPGHGGTDPGHLSSHPNHLPEKSLNLILAKKLGNYIEKYLKNIKVIYTRTDDTFPSLNDRVAMANTMGVDYFISVHCNANARKTVHGTESHVHSMTSKTSVALAREFEKEFSTRAGRKSRGVKDGNDREHSIQVLKYTRMTSVLVECGFLTNEREANYLNTENGQDIIASAMFRALRTQLTKNHSGISFTKAVAEVSEKNSAVKNDGTYHIQLMSSKEPIDTDSDAFKRTGLKVTRVKLETSSAYKYKYTTGPYKDKGSAEKDLEKARSNGFKDALLIKM